jgi:hypothetical protein
VLAGAAALGFGWWGQQGLLFDTKALSPVFYVLVVLFVHLLALGSIGGGMAVLVAPRLGRIAMLSSAVGWLLLIALLGGGIKPVVGLLMALSAAGGLGAFLPSVQTPLFRLERVDAPMWRPSRKVDRTPPPPPRRATARPAPAPAPPPSIIYEDHSKPFVAPPEDEEDHSRPFVEPPPEPSPAIGAIEREDFFESRRKPAPPPPRPRRRQRGTSWAGVAGVALLVLAVGGTAIAVVYDSLTRDGGTVLPATASVAEVPSEAVQVPSEDPPEKASSASIAASQASSSESSQASLPGEDRLPAGSPNLALLPSDASASASASSSPEIDLADDPDFTPSAPGAADSASVAAVSSVLPPVDAAMASLPPITPPSTFKSPFEYCASVANTDSPDAKKITDGVAALTTQARTEAALPNGEVRWRCMENAVWVCVQPAGALSCDKVPSATDRVLICAAHPDTPGIRNAGGDWSCNGFTPVVSAAQLNAADRRGFDKAAWRKLTPPPAPPGQG